MEPSSVFLQVEDRPLVKSSSIRLRGEFGKGARDFRLQKKDEAVMRVGRKKQHKINLDEAEGKYLEAHCFITL